MSLVYKADPRSQVDVISFEYLLQCSCNSKRSYSKEIGDLVSDYENEHLPMPKGDGRAALAFLMEQHGLGQSDLTEVATPSVISEILSGKRQLNIRHIKALSERFNVSADTFF